MSHVSFIPAGRAGNFFFTCAAAFAYAKKHGLKFSVPTRTSNEFWSPIYLKHLQDPTYNAGIPAIVVKEKNFHYDEIPFDESWRNNNITLQGYFQSELYFKDYKDEMIESFNLRWELIPDVCSIQARFGDYLTIAGKHILVDEPYLTKAMALITEKTGITRFKVFSDDLNYFQNKFGHLYNFEYSTNSDIMQDFIEISCCHSNINSSSTFSWWSSYINRNHDKVIITQELWFQAGWGGADTKDIIPDTWIKL
ncbi:MAG TPA: alpha-1,2-fucosyltransferase [Chitinophagaceae bacterium]|mgnify:CR=1 FL=1|nr:alpha-1,2-fucosyltransferase [Chitinophagaceae bacterium]